MRSWALALFTCGLAFTLCGCPDSHTCADPTPLPSSPEGWGRFDPPNPTLMLLPDGRNAKVISDFTYVDLQNRRWKVPAGTVVDGASIPKLLWSSIGGPFEGKYRNASIVHDYYCCFPDNHSSAEIACMFRQACLAGGTPISTSNLMFGAVYDFGPQFGPGTTRQQCSLAPEMAALVTLEQDRLTGTLPPDLARVFIEQAPAERLNLRPTRMTTPENKRRFSAAVFARRSPTRPLATTRAATVTTTMDVAQRWEQIRAFVQANPNASARDIERAFPRASR